MNDTRADNDDEDKEDQFILKERAKKKRKLARELRKYTGVPSDKVIKCKGWSNEGLVAFENYVKEIKVDVEEDKYNTWETGYREVMERLGIKKKQINGPLPEARYEPNLNVCWESFS